MKWPSLWLQNPDVKVPRTDHDGYGFVSLDTSSVLVYLDCLCPYEIKIKDGIESKSFSNRS